ncbi:MAG: type I DNA topoisomerase [Acidimicrobiia bacterium]
MSSNRVSAKKCGVVPTAGSAASKRSGKRGGGRTSSSQSSRSMSDVSEGTLKSSSRSGYNLVVVESPTKAKTIERYLGTGFKVIASLGHVRDLPKKDLGVDVDKNFEPKYEVIPKSKKVVGQLKKAASTAEAVYLATDYDREGEAIAWHVLQAANIEPAKAKRVTFTEITRSAIEEAFKHPRDIDSALVDAQQARRVLDRLVGYKLSPFLWTKIRRNLSAGRVQSVALRLIVDREREIQNFQPREYWTVEARLSRVDDPQGGVFSAQLHKVRGKKPALETEEQATKHAEALRNASYRVEEVRKKQVRRNPPPPFTTSTLQQEASRKLGFTGSKTMLVAQQLYEGVELGSEGQVGLITYMRTDSVQLSKEAVDSIVSTVESRFGKEYLPQKPHTYKTKSRGAQEAHEAIRPTYADKYPDSVRAYLTDDQFKLYRLIWQRTIASQMKEALFDQTSVDISATGGYLLRATGQVRVFDGFMRVYTEGTDEGEGEEGTGALPDLQEGENLLLVEVVPEQHFTQPPPRYTDASLIKALEENGIGRPSTYAPTISTLLERGYVRRENKKLVPEETGFVVVDFLVEHFPDIVDVGFTARMEEDLDEIASRKRQWVPVIRDFYEEFARHLEKKDHEVQPHLEEADETCQVCGSKMVVRLGRYGRFLSCSRYPECKFSKPLNKPEQPQPTGETCPECKKPLVKRHGRYGDFVGCSGYPECRYIKREDKPTGARCPKCKDGELVERRTRRGKLFFSCSRYPDCEFASWKRPLADLCPKCGGTQFVERNRARCSSCSAEFELTEASDNESDSGRNGEIAGEVEAASSTARV